MYSHLEQAWWVIWTPWAWAWRRWASALAERRPKTASILLWGWMWGVVGILIAVPLLVCIKLVCDSVSSLRLLSEFLGR